MHTNAAALDAYTAAIQAAASNGARGLLALEMDAQGVQALTIEVEADGSCVVTLLDGSAAPVGGYTL